MTYKIGMRDGIGNFSDKVAPARRLSSGVANHTIRKSLLGESGVRELNRSSWPVTKVLRFV